VYSITCAECGDVFTASRSATTCGTRCRKRRSRRLASATRARLDERIRQLARLHDATFDEALRLGSVDAALPELHRLGAELLRLVDERPVSH